MAAMDPSHAAIKPGEHADAAQKPKTEIVEVQAAASVPKSELDKQLEQTTKDFFNKKNEAAQAKVEHERFKDFRRSDNIEDRRGEKSAAVAIGYAGDRINKVVQDLPRDIASLVEAKPDDTQSGSVIAKQLGVNDLDKIGPVLKKEVEERHQQEAQAKTEAQYEEYRKTKDKIDHRWDLDQ